MRLSQVGDAKLKYPFLALACLGFGTAAFANEGDSGNCAGELLRIKGVVTTFPANPEDLTDDAKCQKAVRLDGADTLADEAIDTVPETVDIVEPICLRVEARGDVNMSGYSVLTSVPLFPPLPADQSLSELGSGAVTPLCFSYPIFDDQENVLGFGGDLVRGCGVPNADGLLDAQPPGSAGLQIFTSQVALEGTIRKNPFSTEYTGTVYTKDTGIITADGFVGQVLLIVGGMGPFAGATGRVGVTGQEGGGLASYTGEMCLP